MSVNRNGIKSFDQIKKRGFFKKIGDAYRRTTLLEKLASFGAILLFLTVIIFSSGSNPLQIIIVVVSAFVLFNLFVYQTRLLLTSIIIAMHIAVLPYVSYIYSALVPDYTGDAITPLVVLSMLTFFFSVVAYRLCRGRYWLTLVYLFFTIDFIAPLISVVFHLQAGTWPAVIAGIAVIVIRSISWRGLFNKKQPVISTQLINGTLDEETRELIQSDNSQAFRIKSYRPLDVVRIVGSKAEIIVPMTTKKPIIINKNRFYHDGAFIEPLLFHIVSQATLWSMKNKIAGNDIVVVALIHNESHFPTSDKWLSVKIAEKGSRHNFGNLILATPEGLKEYQKLYVNDVMKDKVLAKIIKSTDGVAYSEEKIIANTKPQQEGN